MHTERDGNLRAYAFKSWFVADNDSVWDTPSTRFIAGSFGSELFFQFARALDITTLRLSGSSLVCMHKYNDVNFPSRRLSVSRGAHCSGAQLLWSIIGDFMVVKSAINQIATIIYLTPAANSEWEKKKLLHSENCNLSSVQSNYRNNHHVALSSLFLLLLFFLLLLLFARCAFSSAFCCCCRFSHFLQHFKVDCVERDYIV